MSAQHTPGPWRVNTAGTSSPWPENYKVTEVYVYAPDTQDDVAVCADIVDPLTQEPSEANARLIAAAPEMLANLREAAATLRHYETLHRAKGTTESDAKAEVNAELAARFEATIAAATGSKP
jgi:hypothetical protein